MKSSKYLINFSLTVFGPCGVYSSPTKYKTIIDWTHHDLLNFTSFVYFKIGPDHMTVYLSPSSGVNLLSSSLGTLYPIEDENGGDRVTYFIYYSHGADVGPWEFSLELVVCLLLWLHLRYKDMNKQNIPNTVA